MEVSGRKDTNVEAELLCQPCQTDGESISAEGYCETCNEYFCSACLKFHRKQSATRNHVIKSKDKMPRDQVQSDPCSELCDVHKTEIVKYFCQDHNVVGCGDCMIVGHKACKVDLVYDVSTNYIYSKELRQIKQKTELLVEEISCRKSDIKCNLKEAAEIHRKVVEEIKCFRKVINIYLDEAESGLLKEAAHLLSADVTLQSKLQGECESMQRELNGFDGDLNRSSEKINKLFITAKFAQKRLSEYQTSVERIASESKIKRYEFQSSKDVMALKALGILSMPGKKSTGKSISDMKAKFTKSLNVEASNESNCWITGLASISCDKILLADNYNRSLKILSLSESKITSMYCIQPPATPWDVTMINADTAAATLPEKAEVIIIKTKNGLSKTGTLKVREQCRGIDHLNGTLAVSFCWPPAVQILNMSAVVLYELSNTSMLSYPGHIAFSSDSKCVYVSDHGKHGIHKLSIDGRFISTTELKDGTGPRGLAVTSDGTVVVCGDGNNDEVTLVVSHGKEILTLETKQLYCPTTVLVCEEQSKMFIFEHIKKCSKSSLKMFELK